MPHLEFLYPIVAMALLTCIVTGLLFQARVAEMMARQIHPQSAPVRSKLSAVLQNTKSADNYNNLFEMPTLFYVLCVILLFTTKPLSPLLLVLAWVYTALRYWHTFVHVGYNKVMHRFKLFVASSAVLAVMWVFAVWQLVG